MVASDVSATHAALVGKGYACAPVKEVKRDDEWLARFFFIQEPDGNKIELLYRYHRYQ